MVAAWDLVRRRHDLGIEDLHQRQRALQDAQRAKQIPAALEELVHDVLGRARPEGLGALLAEDALVGAAAARDEAAEVLVLTDDREVEGVVHEMPCRHRRIADIRDGRGVPVVYGLSVGISTYNYMIKTYMSLRLSSSISKIIISIPDERVAGGLVEGSNPEFDEPTTTPQFTF